jgi:enoyl-CoA hydratase/carnithine racemase
MTAMTQSAPQADPPFILSEVRDGVGIITLNRPEKRNPLSTAMITAIHDQVAAWEHDKSVRVMVIKALGPVFSAGHDLQEVLSMDQEQAAGLMDHCTTMMEKIRLTPKPIIAQVHALATAAGCQLAASCDLVVASETASFQTPGVLIGLFCSTPMVPLSKVIPPKKAVEMLFTGKPMPASEAALHGLVNRVVPPAQLDEATLGLAAEIKAHSLYTLGLGKEAFYKQLPMGMQDSYAVGKEAMLKNLPAHDAQEGISAFLQKRKPEWRD